MWFCALLYSQPAWMAVETAMPGALASWCINVKLCNCVPGAIAVALPAIWIVKAKENQNSYGNTIELNFLLKGLNLLLKNEVNNVCLWPFHVRTCECICLWPAFQKRQSLAYYGTGTWVLFGWQAELYFEEKYSDSKQSAGSHIWSCWLLWH